MRNVQLDELQDGIKIGWRNINNLKYADQLSSVTQSCPNFSDPMDCNTPGFNVYHQIMELAQKLMSIELRCYPTTSSSIIPFSSGSFPMSQFFASVAKYWSFSFSISPSNEYSRLIAFTTNWIDLLVVQRILKSLLQHHSSKESIFQHSAFFMV